MDLSDGDFSFDLVFREPKQEFTYASCPRCKTVSSTFAMQANLSTRNIVCKSCKFKYCSYCGKSRHLLFGCKKAKEYKRELTHRDDVMIPEED